MAKRTKGGFEQIAAMPWWLGILIGLIDYVVIRHGIGWHPSINVSEPLRA